MVIGLQITKKTDKYEKLIVRLQQEFPEIKVAVVGDPEGAYFSDGVPFDTLDLINIDPINRVSVQIAAMERSLFALGSRSGGLCLAYCADCPVFKWSNPHEYGYSKTHQHTSTPEYGYIYPKAQPEVGEIFEAIKRNHFRRVSIPSCGWRLGHLRLGLTNKNGVNGCCSSITGYNPFTKVTSLGRTHHSTIGMLRWLSCFRKTVKKNDLLHQPAAGSRALQYEATLNWTD